MDDRDLIKSKIADYVGASNISESLTPGGGRTYEVPDGSRYPSVTTVLSAMQDKTWLKEWKARVGEEKAKEITTKACSRGTSMHSLIESSFKGEPLDKEASGYRLYKQLRIYLKNIDPLGLEVPLWSHRLKIAGRTDCIGYYKGKLSIIDYKTSRREKSSEHILNYFHQSTIYSMMALERLQIEAKQIVILIGVDDGLPQEFIRNVKDYIHEVIGIVDSYHSGARN